MDAYRDVASELGVEEPSSGHSLAFELISQIEKGLAVSTLDRLAKTIAPDDATFKYRIVPKATYVRRKRSRRLSAGESADVARLARVWSFAKEVWGGEEEARAFLFRKHPMLEDRRPVDVAVTNEIGARLVEDVLGGLAYGTAA